MSVCLRREQATRPTGVYFTLSILCVLHFGRFVNRPYGGFICFYVVRFVGAFCLLRRTTNGRPYVRFHFALHILIMHIVCFRRDVDPYGEPTVQIVRSIAYLLSQNIEKRATGWLVLIIIVRLVLPALRFRLRKFYRTKRELPCLSQRHQGRKLLCRR